MNNVNNVQYIYSIYIFFKEQICHGVSGFNKVRQWSINLVIVYLSCKGSSRQGFTDSHSVYMI